MVRIVPPLSSPTESSPCHLTRTQQDQRQRRDRRLARYEAVLDLHRQGLGVRAIARQLRIGRRLVRQYLAAPSFPERAPNRPRRTLLTPYEPCLRMRWEAGCQNAAALWRELRAQGFTGTEGFVRQQVRHWRATPDSRASPRVSAVPSAARLPYRHRSGCCRRAKRSGSSSAMNPL